MLSDGMVADSLLWVADACQFEWSARAACVSIASGTTAAGACPDALRPPPSGQRAAPFFEALLGFWVALRVRGARLLAREPHSAQHPRHARRVITFAEMRRDPVAQIGAGPGATAVTVRARDPAGPLPPVPLP